MFLVLAGWVTADTSSANSVQSSALIRPSCDMGNIYSRPRESRMSVHEKKTWRKSRLQSRRAATTADGAALYRKEQSRTLLAVQDTWAANLSSNACITALPAVGLAIQMSLLRSCMLSSRRAQILRLNGITRLRAHLDHGSSDKSQGVTGLECPTNLSEGRLKGNYSHPLYAHHLKFDFTFIQLYIMRATLRQSLLPTYFWTTVPSLKH